MEALVALLLQFLPANVAALKCLKFLPDAAETVKELVALIQRTIKTLQAPEVPLTDEQRAILLAAIRAMINDGYHDDPASDNTP